jgi:PKD repeat protein
MKKLLVICICLIIVLSCSKETDNTPIISPVSGFTFSYNSSNYKTVQFQNASHFINSNTKYYWTFGDSAVSEKENTSYTYKEDGDYKIVLKVTNGNLSDCSVQTVHITKFSIDSTAKAPIVAYVYSQNKNAIYFQDASAGTNSNTSYFWTFGDGKTDTNENPNHTYVLDGVYYVVLKVTTNERSYSFSKSILVTASSNPAYDTIRPIPMFTYTYLNGTVYFVNASSFTTSITTYHWYFGDGTEDSNENPTHVFAANGSYSVVLKVSNVHYSVTYEKQLDIPVIKPIVIDPLKKPVANFVYTKQTIGVNFQNSSSNVMPTTVYFWTFGDGLTSTEENPFHNYAKNGSYKVVLKVTNENISDSYSYPDPIIIP